MCHFIIKNNCFKQNLTIKTQKCVLIIKNKNEEKKIDEQENGVLPANTTKKKKYKQLLYLLT